MVLFVYVGTKSTFGFSSAHMSGVVTTVGLPMKVVLYQDIVLEKKSLPSPPQGFVLFAHGNMMPLLVDLGLLVLLVELGLLGVHRVGWWLRAPLRKPLLR